MENCLITKLKGSVTGDAPIFGKLEMVIAGEGLNFGLLLGVTYNEESTVLGDNGIVFRSLNLSEEYPNPFTLTPTINGFYVCCTEDAKVTLTNKYKFKAINRQGYFQFMLQGVKEFIGGSDSFIYSIPENTTKVGLPYYFGKLNLSDIVPKIAGNNTSIVAFDFSNSPLIGGNIDVFSNINNVKSIDVGTSPLITGTIADLKNITTLENIALYRTQVGGTIEEFVAGQRAAGRTTGTVSGNSTGWGIVTFDGARTHAKGAVSWTADTITMDGVTINA